MLLFLHCLWEDFCWIYTYYLRFIFFCDAGYFTLDTKNTPETPFKFNNLQQVCNLKLKYTIFIYNKIHIFTGYIYKGSYVGYIVRADKKNTKNIFFIETVITFQKLIFWEKPSVVIMWRSWFQSCINVSYINCVFRNTQTIIVMYKRSQNDQKQPFWVKKYFSFTTTSIIHAFLLQIYALLIVVELKMIFLCGNFIRI